MCPFTGCVSIREIRGDEESKVTILFRMIPGCRYQQQYLKGKTTPNQGSTSAKYVSSTDGFVQKRPSTKQIIKNNEQTFTSGLQPIVGTYFYLFN